MTESKVDKFYRIVKERAEDGEATTYEDVRTHPDVDIQRRQIKRHFSKPVLSEKLVNIGNDGGENGKAYFIPKEFGDIFPEEYEREQKEEKIRDKLSEVERVREDLKNRILREPTKEEVAEELGQEPNKEFSKRFTKNVSDEWRSPKESSIEEKRSEVQEKVEDALKIHLGWDSKEENDSSEYYKDNKDIFYEFDFHVEEWLTHEVPQEFKVKVPPKLGKFMEEDEFLIRVPLNETGEMSTRDYCLSQTKQARRQCVESKDSWDDL